MTGRISTHLKSRELQAYAVKLIDAGFTLRVPPPQLTVDGKVIPVDWVVYEKGGNAGTVQKDLDGYSHSMPVRPTQEDGSAILMFDADWPLHLTHAEKTAQPENRGKYNGNKLFRNHGLSSRQSQYVVVEKDEPRTVPVKVVWQEITQYQTVVEVELLPGMMGTKDGRNKVRAAIEAALDGLNEEDVSEALDEYWGGPHRHIETMEPVWDAVEPATKV